MYQVPKEVELEKYKDECLNHYEEIYENRYGTKPYTIPEDHQVFKWAIQRFGREKTIELLDAYILNNDEWFLKKAHALSVFKTNINQVLVKVGAQTRSNPGKPIKIQSWVSCLKCGFRFLMEHMSDNADACEGIICEKCKCPF